MTEAHRTGREVGDEGQKEACRPSSTSVIRIAMVEKIQAAGKVCTGAAGSNVSTLSAAGQTLDSRASLA
jgi:hypothetical protein